MIRGYGGELTENPFTDSAGIALQPLDSAPDAGPLTALYQEQLNRVGNTLDEVSRAEVLNIQISFIPGSEATPSTTPPALPPRPQQEPLIPPAWTEAVADAATAITNGAKTFTVGFKNWVTSSPPYAALTESQHQQQAAWQQAQQEPQRAQQAAFAQQQAAAQRQSPRAEGYYEESGCCNTM